MAQLLQLPDEILIIILQYLQSGTAGSLLCSRIYYLIDDIWKTRFVSRFGQRGLKLVQQLQSDPQRRLFKYLTNNDNINRTYLCWKNITHFFEVDWMFFDSNCIQNVLGAEVSMIQDLNDPQLSRGTWKIIQENKWGNSIHASNVHTLHLKCNTILQSGKYWIYLNFRVQNINAILPIRFKVLTTDKTMAIFSEFIPDSALYSMHGQQLQDYKDFKPIDLCLGQIEVNKFGYINYVRGYDYESSGHEDPNDKSSWGEVVLEVEENGGFMLRHVLFNYVYIEPVKDEENNDQYWYPGSRKISPDLTLRNAYEEFRRLKLAYRNP